MSYVNGVEYITEQCSLAEVIMFAAQSDKHMRKLAQAACSNCTPLNGKGVRYYFDDGSVLLVNDDGSVTTD